MSIADLNRAFNMLRRNFKHQEVELVTYLVDTVPEGHVLIAVDPIDLAVFLDTVDPEWVTDELLPSTDIAVPEAARIVTRLLEEAHELRRPPRKERTDA